MPDVHNRYSWMQGFSITELIIAMTLFVLVVMTFVSILSSIQYNQRTIQYLDLAKNAAVSKMEKVRSNSALLVEGETSFTSTLPDGLPPGTTGTVTISPAVHVPDMKNVEVEIKFRYPAGGMEREVEMSSVIGEKGIVK